MSAVEQGRGWGGTWMAGCTWLMVGWVDWGWPPCGSPFPGGCIDRGHRGQVFGDMVDTLRSGQYQPSGCWVRQGGPRLGAQPAPPSHRAPYCWRRYLRRRHPRAPATRWPPRPPATTAPPVPGGSCGCAATATSARPSAARAQNRLLRPAPGAGYPVWRGLRSTIRAVAGARCFPCAPAGGPRRP